MLLNKLTTVQLYFFWVVLLFFKHVPYQV
uniref:Uncharacterized protein n=1 Tax=Rhizophora mucronata TaxID=61149 RepID=A0A2P2QDB4_RHIMU